MKFHFQNGTKMTTLGKYCHDFPRLAKESGYCFELHRGRVNWTQIESLNIDDIVSSRNFELLEQNLANVINCNLEREYDVKILDQNFVKLFQLAQLGVDYLSYCELYLDRCVILLQQQLASYQEECELLREENQKKDEQLKESKKKLKAESFYQCQKCEKVFLTEIYLKSHEKRRHSSVQQSYKIDEIPKLELINKSQQTDEERRTLTVSTQTILETENIPEKKKENVTEIIKENAKENEISFLKKEHELKMGNLEKELNDLKERLQTTEKRLTEKTESSEVNHSHQCPFPPNPMFYPQVIPFISPYVSQAPYINADYSQQPFMQQTLQKPEEKKPMIEKQLQVDGKFSPEAVATSSVKKDFGKKETLVERPIRPKIIKSRKKLEYDKENVDPQLQLQPVEEEMKPVPFPRKPKKLFENTEKEEPTTNVIPFVEDKPENEKKALVQEEKRMSSPSVRDKETKSKSFFKKMVAKNSPKIQELSKNLKRSLTNLYDSVSSSGKESLKTKEEDSDRDVTSNVVQGLNSRLKELGIDPEWTGIPKETMKKKLKTLEHRRNLLARENPTYPSIRKRLEKTIFKKMNKSSAIPQGKIATSAESLFEESLKSLESTPSPAVERRASFESKKEKEQETEPESIKNQSPKMYDFDFDSESDNSNAEIPLQLNKERNKFSSYQNFPEKIGNEIEEIKIENETVKPVVKEMDFSIFQIGKTKNNSNKKEEVSPSPAKSTFLNTVDELQTDSDFEDDFLKEFEETSFKSIHGFLNSTENDKKIKDEPTNEKMESQSILKTPQSSQAKLQSSVKKKVLFADYPESQSSSTTLNEIKPKLNVKISNKTDTWSSDSDWDQ